MATKRDYYDVLGVAKTASAAEIKAAYRKLALKWHPDKHAKDKAAAEEKFKEINEAYQILSDKDKKQAYDQFGHAAFDPSKGGFGGGDPFGGFKTGPFTWSYNQGGGNPFEGVDFGDPFDIFEQFFGGGFGRQRNQRPHYSLSITFEEAVKGTSKEVSVSGKSQKITIPAGVDDGTRIRFDDFEISINVQTHPKFTRDGANLFIDHEIPFSFAALGGTTKVETLGAPIEIRVRPGTQSHTLVRLRGEGIPMLRSSGKGDLFIKLKVTVPENLTSEQTKLLEKLKKAGI